MPAPLAQAAVLLAGRARAMRRTLFIFAVLFIAALGVLATPVALLAATVASTAPVPAAPPPGSGTSAASGEWAMPLAGEFMKGRGFGHNPVIGCSYCSVDHQGYDMSQGCGSTIYAAGE